MTQQDIFTKYPAIFKNVDNDPSVTCMCWGLEVPSSWLPIIDQLCNAMQNYTYTTGTAEGTFKFPQVVADQVKEKYNSLRFYYHLEYPEDVEIPKLISERHHSYIDGMIAMAECLITNLNQP